MMILNYDKTTNREINKHGTPSLPYDIYGTYMPLFLKSFPMHWHDELEIVYAYEGTARYIVDTGEYIVNSGDILIIPPNSLHAFEQYNDNVFSGKVILFSRKMVDSNHLDVCSVKYIAPLFNNEIYFPLHIKSDNKHNQHLRVFLDSAVSNHIEKNSGYELKVKIAFLEFIQYFYSNDLCITLKRENRSEKISEQVKEIINYITEHYSEKITLDELSRVVSLSTYYMAHIFKQYTGISPNKYINEHRLAVAGKRLLNENTSILNIAIECGFNNISYFNRAFKNKYGMTPNSYRNGK